MKNAKKKTSGLMIFSICLLIVAIATPITLALFSDRKESTTQITFGKIEIDEGKTSVSVAVDKLLPGDNVFEDKVIAAKDVFSESFIMRVKYEFTAANDADNELLAAYLDILSGNPFTTVDGYGDVNYEDDKLYVVKDNAYVALFVAEGEVGSETYREATKDDAQATKFYVEVAGEPVTYAEEVGAVAVRKPEIANGLVVKTQAVDTNGNIYVSEYDAVNNEYTLSAEAIGTVTDGYAKNYRWFFHEDYFYLCEYFADDTAAADVRIRNVERSEASRAEKITLEGTEYDLTTKAGREDAVAYYETSYEPSFILKKLNASNEIVDGEEGTDANQQTLADLRAAAFDNDSTNAVPSAYESYKDAQANFEDVKADYNQKNTSYVTGRAALVTSYNALVAAYEAIATPTTEQTALKAAADAYYTAVLAQLDVETTTEVATTDLDNAMTAVTDDADTVKVAATALKNDGGQAIGYKQAYNTSKAARDTAKAAEELALAQYKLAIKNFQIARDVVAAAMKDLQELYVFALDGEYNKIPLELPQIVEYVEATQDDIDAGNYVTEDGVNYKTNTLGHKVVKKSNLQYNKQITLTMSFEAVQSANLRIDGEDADLVLSETEIADLVEFFPEANA